jgi:Protein of unknown function (DUF3828)
MARSCRQFTQSFYDWYVPFTQKDASGPAWCIALERKASAFSRRLLQALKQDCDAQVRAKGELVGLDYDPFLSTQDPADHYEARKTVWANGKCSVEVWRASPTDTAAKSDKPAVVAELNQNNQRWCFSDFVDPDLNTDLLNELQQLKKARMK